MGTIKPYNIIAPIRTYSFDDNGVYCNNKLSTVADRWDVTVAEREILIPDITISHVHLPDARQRRAGSWRPVRNFLPSVDTLCGCGIKFPKTILEEVYSINNAHFKSCYAAIERGASYRLDLLKKLADGWYLDENKKQEEPALFHICNENHPGYLYYGKGIPISQIAMPPWEDKCKTCRLDIPKGIRLALLIISKRITLK